MYLRFYRFFPSFRISSSNDSSSSSPPLSPLPSYSPLRTRLSTLVSHTRTTQFRQQQHQRQQQPKAVRWGPITEIPPSPFIFPFQMSMPMPMTMPLPFPKPVQDQDQDQDQEPKKKTPKSIMKPPTPLDHEMLHENLWELIHQMEEKARLNYEYLDLAGDDDLDSWFRVEERAMRRAANRAAKTRRVGLGMVDVNMPRPKVEKRRKRAARRGSTIGSSAAVAVAAAASAAKKSTTKWVPSNLEKEGEGEGEDAGR